MRKRMTLKEAIEHVARDENVVKVMEFLVLHGFGERCHDYEPGCPICEAWADFDAEVKRRMEGNPNA